MFSIKDITGKLILFLLLFTLNAAEPEIDVFCINTNEESVKNVPYKPDIPMNHKEAYIFLIKEDIRTDIIYCMGAQLKQYTKVPTAYVTGRMTKKLLNISSEGDVRITRKILKEKNVNFGDIQSANVSEKIPRVYEVAGAYTIRQVQLNCDLINKENSYVLNDGLLVTLYYSPTCEIKRKVADSLAKYIINVENGGNYGSDDAGNSKNTLETFCSKILNASQHSLPMNNMGNSKAVKKLSKNSAVPTGKCTAFLEMKKKEIFAYLKENMILKETDSIYNDRILSSAEASSSTLLTRRNSAKNSKAANKKTTSKVLAAKKSSFFESVFKKESIDVATTSTATDQGNNKYGNLIPIFLGPEECAPKTQPPLIDTLKSTCLYVLEDLENNELLIYTGKDSHDKHLSMVLASAEMELNGNPLMKITTLLEGNTIPTHFMIHIESEIRKYLREY